MPFRPIKSKNYYQRLLLVFSFVSHLNSDFQMDFVSLVMDATVANVDT